MAPSLSLNCTVPVASRGVMDAVKVTAFPRIGDVVEAETVTDVGIFPTDRVKDALACAPFMSVIVTVRVKKITRWVGVPVIAPFDESIERPVGSDGLMEKVSLPEPPPPVTGVKEGAGELKGRVFDANATVAVSRC